MKLKFKIKVLNNLEWGLAIFFLLNDFDTWIINLRHATVTQRERGSWVSAMVSGGCGLISKLERELQGCKAPYCLRLDTFGDSDVYRITQKYVSASILAKNRRNYASNRQNWRAQNFNKISIHAKERKPLSSHHLKCTYYESQVRKCESQCGYTSYWWTARQSMSFGLNTPKQNQQVRSWLRYRKIWQFDMFLDRVQI